MFENVRDGVVYLSEDLEEANGGDVVSCPRHVVVEVSKRPWQGRRRLQSRSKGISSIP